MLQKKLTDGSNYCIKLEVLEMKMKLQQSTILSGCGDGCHQALHPPHYRLLFPEH